MDNLSDSDEESSQSSETEDEDEIEVEDEVKTYTNNDITRASSSPSFHTEQHDGTIASDENNSSSTNTKTSDQKEVFVDEVHESIQHPVVGKCTYNFHNDESLHNTTSGGLVRSKKERFMLKFVGKVRSILESTQSIGKRNDILKELFSNIATEIEDSVRVYVHSDEVGKESTEKSSSSSSSSSPSPSSSTIDTPPIYYYELLADRYCSHPDEEQVLQPILMALWGNPNVPIIYSAMLYKWIFKYGDDKVRNFNMLIKGLNRLLWFDLETVSTRFYSIYMYLMNNVLLNTDMWDPALRCCRGSGNSSVVDRFFGDFFNLVARFFLYYEKPEAVTPFLEKFQVIFNTYGTNETFHVKSTPQPQTPDNNKNNITGISAADIFVQCVIRQIKLVKNEYVLLRYIQNCVQFKGLRLSDETRVKLQSTLYDYTSPGGPAYAPRSVRNASKTSLDMLFPRGKLSRKTIHYIFRLLHPYYSTRSLLHWVYSIFKPVLGFFGPSLVEEEEEEALKLMNQK